MSEPTEGHGNSLNGLVSSEEPPNSDLSLRRYDLKGLRDPSSRFLPVEITFHGASECVREANELARKKRAKKVAEVRGTHDGQETTQPVEPPGPDGESISDGVRSGYELGELLGDIWEHVLTHREQEELKTETWRGVAQPFRKGARLCAAAFPRMLDVLGKINYRLEGVAMREEAAPAYAVLIRVIAALGNPLPPDEVKNRPKPRTIERFRHDRERACAALQRFCDVFPTDCWTAYYRNRRLNRVYRLSRDWEGQSREHDVSNQTTRECRDSLRRTIDECQDKNPLAFPETMEGFVWRKDLPTQLLFSSSDTTLFPPFPSSTPIEQTAPGKFQDREQIDPKRTVGIRLSYDQTRLVLFMNWRTLTGEESKAAAADRPALRAVWDDLARHHGPEDERPESPMQSLQMAVRYFTGWLAVAGIDLSEAVESQETRAAPGFIVKKVVGASLIGKSDEEGKAVDGSLNDESDEEKGKALCEAAEALLSVLNASVSLHWAKKVAAGRPSPYVLKFQKAKYPCWCKREEGDCTCVAIRDESGFSQPEFPIAADEHGLVADSICAQSALWDIPLLIRNLDRKIPGTTKRWRDIHVSDGTGDCSSELTVPLSDDEGPVCVLNVECHADQPEEDLQPSHVRQAELVMHLFRSLRIAGKSNDERVKEFIGRINSSNPSTAQDLMKMSLNWIQSVLHTDLAYALIYDPRVRVFRPMGVTVSPNNVAEFLANRSEKENLNRKHGAPELGFGAEEEQRKQLHALVEHAVAGRLLPGRRGKTWTVFTEGTPVLAGVDGQRPWCTAGGEREDDYSDDKACNEYARYRFALPLASRKNVKADGVVWLAWRNLSEGVQALRQRASGELTHDEYSDFASNVETRIGAAVSVVAAAYAIFRYIAPDSATDPLPYRR